MFTYLTFLIGLQAPFGELKDLFGIAGAPKGAGGIRTAARAHPAVSPLSSSFPASMFLARKSRLFKAGTVIPMISAISA